MVSAFAGQKIGSGDVADNLKSIFTEALCFIVVPDTVVITTGRPPARSFKEK